MCVYVSVRLKLADGLARCAIVSFLVVFRQ